MELHVDLRYLGKDRYGKGWVFYYMNEISPERPFALAAVTIARAKMDQMTIDFSSMGYLIKATQGEEESEYEFTQRVLNTILESAPGA